MGGGCPCCIAGRDVVLIIISAGRMAGKVAKFIITSLLKLKCRGANSDMRCANAGVFGCAETLWG